MNITVCPDCAHRIHNKARLCLYCLADRPPSRLRPSPPTTRMPGLDARILETWAYPFQLIEKAGGAGLPQWHLLTWTERLVVVFNPWALLLGPLYFIHLGLWKRALAMTAVWVLLPAVGLLLLNHAVARVAGSPSALLGQWLAVRPLAWLALWTVAALAFAARANRDFYRKLQLNEERQTSKKDEDGNGFNRCR